MKVHSFKQNGIVEFTLHCCACRLWEEWDQQEMDEVEEKQGGEEDRTKDMLWKMTEIIN